jgi:hypothetical protein
MIRLTRAQIVLDREDTGEDGANPQKLRISGSEDLSRRENVFRHGGADGEHRLVHDLAQP